MDLDGKELNHFKVAFFNVIEKALANAILDLNASICS